MHAYTIKLIGILVIVVTCITIAYLYMQASLLQEEIDAEKPRRAGQDRDNPLSEADDLDANSTDSNDDVEDE